MRHGLRCVSGLVPLCLLALAIPATAAPALSTEAWGRRPLAFEENRGQTDARVLFLSRAPGYQLFLTSAEAVLSPAGGGALRLRWLEAGPAPRPMAEGELPGRADYILGNEPARWRTGVPLWSRVRLEQLWPGIDLVFYGNPGELEHDFVVAPGADPGRILIGLDGAGPVRIDASGDLIAPLGSGGEIRLRRPVAYQESGGSRREVPCSFRLLPGNRLAFTMEAWDRTRPLVIDPVVVWSTYLGGSDEDEARGVAVDPAGNLWVTGSTRSPDFPVQGSTPPSELFADAFVSKMSPSGALLFSAYLGGRFSVDEGYAVAVDAVGNAWVTGRTDSPDFPLVNPVPEAYWGDGGEIFVAKFAPDGQLLASSHLGGVMDIEAGEDVAVGPDGGPWIVGHTYSPDFPVVRPLVPFEHDNGFVMKLSADGTELQLSTTVGSYAGLSSVVVDPAGRAWLAGSFEGDVLVTGIEPAGPSVVWSTRFGGAGGDGGRAITLAPDSSLWVTGVTGSADFPARGLQIPSPRGGEDVFVVRLRPDGWRLVYSAAFGGSGNDEVRDISVDGTGRVYLAGATTSADFPAKSPLQGPSVPDAFAVQMTPADGIVWATWLGGSAQDEAFGVVADRRGNIYLAGRTSSTDFPAANALQPAFAGGPADGFVIRLRR
ncbi:MAG TPA: SBBP repeat-containing protein [Thermoanaerobaculia bacterium]|nr:SBBP repeat-containing protein [Thermoanaerobaculia bacterium]